MPGRHVRTMRRVAPQAKRRDDDEQDARRALQHHAIHVEAECYHAGHQRDRCGMSDGDRQQGSQRLPAIVRAQSASGGQHPAGGRVQPVQRTGPRDGQPWPNACHVVLASSEAERLSPPDHRMASE